MAALAKEWLRWHFQLGHMSFQQIRCLMRTGVLAKSQTIRYLHTTIGNMTEAPKCAACLFAKARIPKTHAQITDQAGALTRNTLIGQEVSTDHYICSTLGRLYTGYGKTDDASLYTGGCVFVDNATGWMHAKHQSILTSHETLRAKEKFEFACRNYGVMVQGYKTDQEASFTSLEFANHLRKFSQTVKFAGTGGHNHNGIAEKGIQDVMSIAGTQLLHSTIY
jgi:hypothetical protein